MISFWGVCGYPQVRAGAPVPFNLGFAIIHANSGKPVNGALGNVALTPFLLSPANAAHLGKSIQQLRKVQKGEPPDVFKPMAEIGAGVYEIIVDTAAGWFRVMYVAKRRYGAVMKEQKAK